MPKGVRLLEAEIDYCVSTMILHNRYFVVFTDASRLGLGGILMQTQRVMAYASR